MFEKKLWGIAKKILQVFNDEPGQKNDVNNHLKGEDQENSNTGSKDVDLAKRIDEDTAGEINVATDVIASIAYHSALDVDDVVDMSSGIVDDVAKFIGKEKPIKGVRVTYDGGLVNVNVYLVVKYGVNISDVAMKVQEKVKSSIETMIGQEVQFVDVHIENVVQEEVQKEKQEEGIVNDNN